MSRLDGRVALVTGSSSGIGEAIVRSFAAEGADVVVNSSSSVDAGTAVAESVGGYYVQADIADDDAVGQMVAATIERYGRLDILVNNAGTTMVIPHDDLDAVTDEVWNTILGTNVVGAWHVIRAAVPHLRANGDGAIVNIGSRAAGRAVGSSIPYAVSKAALHHLTVLLASTLGPEIRVNTVAPGLIDTPWTADWAEMRAQILEKAPLRRLGLPTDIADAVLGMVHARYVTGQVVYADGGLMVQ